MSFSINVDSEADDLKSSIVFLSNRSTHLKYKSASYFISRQYQLNSHLIRPVTAGWLLQVRTHADEKLSLIYRRAKSVRKDQPSSSPTRGHKTEL